MKKPNILMAVNRHWRGGVFSEADFGRLGKLGCVLNRTPPEAVDRDFLVNAIGDAEVVVTSWNSACLDAEVMAEAGSLKLLCHAAGSVRPVVSDALWDQGVRVVSGAAAIGPGVAEFCLGLALMASKRVFWMAEGTRRGAWAETRPCFGGAFELYQQKVGIIGAGHIGRHLAGLFTRNFVCEVCVYDPYLSDADAASLGVTKVETLDEMFSSCRVVSLNAPTNEGTRDMLRGAHFALLPAGAVFINTAGAIQIVEEEFLAELRRGRFVACIDRCLVEPCALDHPYRTLPNVILTPHVAGAIAENRMRIGTLVADEIEAWCKDEPLRHEVTREALAKMA